MHHVKSQWDLGIVWLTSSLSWKTKNFRCPVVVSFLYKNPLFFWCYETSAIIIYTPLKMNFQSFMHVVCWLIPLTNSIDYCIDNSLCSLPVSTRHILYTLIQPAMETVVRLPTISQAENWLGNYSACVSVFWGEQMCPFWWELTSLYQPFALFARHRFFISPCYRTPLMWKIVPGLATIKERVVFLFERSDLTFALYSVRGSQN